MRLDSIRCARGVLAAGVACLTLATLAPAWANMAHMNWAVGKPLSGVREKLITDGWEPQQTGLTTAKGAP